MRDYLSRNVLASAGRGPGPRRALHSLREEAPGGPRPRRRPRGLPLRRRLRSRSSARPRARSSSACRPRMRIRRGAALELPHIMLLIDDPGRDRDRADLRRSRERLPKLYDFDLMLGSGRRPGLEAWAIPPSWAALAEAFGASADPADLPGEVRLGRGFAAPALRGGRRQPLPRDGQGRVGGDQGRARRR